MQESKDTPACQCQVCLSIRSWKARLGVSTPEQREAFNEMLDAWETADTDATYYRCILNGTWPNSVAILEKALEKARALSNTTS